MHAQSTKGVWQSSADRITTHVQRLFYAVEPLVNFLFRVRSNCVWTVFLEGPRRYKGVGFRAVSEKFRTLHQVRMVSYHAGCSLIRQMHIYHSDLASKAAVPNLL